MSLNHPSFQFAKKNCLFTKNGGCCYILLDQVREGNEPAPQYVGYQIIELLVGVDSTN
jgi:hypothetical protein